MGAQLNIKNPETVRLARELAGRSGKTVTETIRAALEKAEADARGDLHARTSAFLSRLHAIPFERPVDTIGKDAHEIIREFHEQEWQEQSGRDQ